MVKVYTVKGCPYCEKVKRYLKSKEVEFVAYDIEQDAEARGLQEVDGDGLRRARHDD